MARRRVRRGPFGFRAGVLRCGTSPCRSRRRDGGGYPAGIEPNAKKHHYARVYVLFGDSDVCACARACEKTRTSSPYTYCDGRQLYSVPGREFPFDPLMALWVWLPLREPGPKPPHMHLPAIAKRQIRAHPRLSIKRGVHPA